MSDTATIRIDCDQQSVCTNMDSVLASTTVAGPLETGRAAAIVTCLLPDIKALMEMSRGQLREAVETRRPTEPNSMDDAALDRFLQPWALKYDLVDLKRLIRSYEAACSHKPHPVFQAAPEAAFVFRPTTRE